MRHHHGRPFGLFTPLIGMFWLVVVLAIAFNPEFRYLMVELFYTVADAFRVIFTGGY